MTYPTNSETNSFNARIRELTGAKDFKQALHEIEDYKSRFPNAADAYRKEADVYQEMGLYDEAMAAIANAVKRATTPNKKAVVCMDAALIYMEVGLLEKAVPYAEEGGQIEFFREESDWYLTEIYIRLGDRAKAQKYLDRLPDDFERHYQLGRRRTTKEYLKTEVSKLRYIVR